MMPYNLTFRRLLRKTVPQLTPEKINEYESLTATRHHLIQEKSLLPPKKPVQPVLSLLIKESAQQATIILSPHKRVLDASQELWVARRQLALQQGHFLQIPPTPGGVWRLFKAMMKYHFWVQPKTFPHFVLNRIKYYIMVFNELITIRKARKDSDSDPGRKPEPQEQN